MRVECRHATYLTTTTTRAPDIFTYLFSIRLSAATRKVLQYWPLDNLGSYSEFLCILWLSLFGSTSTEVLARHPIPRTCRGTEKEANWMEMLNKGATTNVPFDTPSRAFQGAKGIIRTWQLSQGNNLVMICSNKLFLPYVFMRWKVMKQTTLDISKEIRSWGTAIS